MTRWMMPCRNLPQRMHPAEDAGLPWALVLATRRSLKPDPGYNTTQPSWKHKSTHTPHPAAPALFSPAATSVTTSHGTSWAQATLNTALSDCPLSLTRLSRIGAATLHTTSHKASSSTQVPEQFHYTPEQSHPRRYLASKDGSGRHDAAGGCGGCRAAGLRGLGSKVPSFAEEFGLQRARLLYGFGSGLQWPECMFKMPHPPFKFGGASNYTNDSMTSSFLRKKSCMARV